MRIVEGVVSLIGNSSTQNGVTKYSVIQIGDETLQKVKSAESLGSYISMALKKGGASKIHMRGKMILGVSLSDGKTFCYAPNFFGAAILTIIGLGLVGWVLSWSNIIANPFAYVIGGLGALTLFQVYGEWLNFQAIKKLRNDGAVSISI